jgi:ribonuclease-3
MLRFLKKLLGIRSEDKSTSERLDAAQRKLERRIGYRFRRLELLSEALTHRSCHAGNHSTRHRAYERLEFLGDSVLGLIVAERLFVDYPQMSEGELTKNKSLLVNRKALAHTAKMIGVGDCVLLSTDEENAGGRRRQSILADCFEALLGAVYKDGGMEAARQVISKLISFDFNRTRRDLSLRNYKGELLELLQSRGEEMPRYLVVAESGPDHRKTFTVEVLVNGKAVGSGTGDSKKTAEQRAAHEALMVLNQRQAKELD